VQIANSDQTMHNVNAMAKDNRGFNFGQEAAARNLRARGLARTPRSPIAVDSGRRHDARESRFRLQVSHVSCALR
jgi:hypothetical protein